MTRIEWVKSHPEEAAQLIDDLVQALRPIIFLAEERKISQDSPDIFMFDQVPIGTKDINLAVDVSTRAAISR